VKENDFITKTTLPVTAENTDKIKRPNSLSGKESSLIMSVN